MDIFNKIVNDEIDLEIMYKFLWVLKLVEDGKASQEVGSAAIGKLLKELYVEDIFNLNINSNKINFDLIIVSCLPQQVLELKVTINLSPSIGYPIVKSLGEIIPLFNFSKISYFCWINFPLICLIFRIC